MKFLDLSISLRYAFYIDFSGLFNLRPQDQLEADLKPQDITGKSSKDKFF